jgi:TetR/AcrR family transcriptional regulator, transcriptional repressor for nem operon
MGRPSEARQRLIAAARDVIFAQSYEGVSVDDLCMAAGVNKSSFYHFFATKQDLLLAAIDSQWQWFEQTVLAPTFLATIPPHERILRFFDEARQVQEAHRQRRGHVRGCPAGNLTLELSTRDERVRARVTHFFQEWLGYFERTLREAKAAGSVPAALDVATTAQALLAYFEGVMLLAKGRNDPSLIGTLRAGVLALMQHSSAVGAQS